MAMRNEFDGTARTPRTGSMSRVLVIGIVACGTLTLLHAQGPTLPPKSESGSAPDTRLITSTQRDEYFISPEDLLDVNVYDMPDIDRKSTRLNSSHVSIS